MRGLYSSDVLPPTPGEAFLWGGPPALKGPSVRRFYWAGAGEGVVPKDIKDLIASGEISGGMIPKTETALNAIEGGVRAVVILDGRAPNACLLELYTDHGAGTLIRPPSTKG